MGMIRILKLIALFSITIFLTIACQSSNINPNTNSPTPSTNIKVAAFMPRDVHKDGWSKSGYEGLLTIEKELGVKIAYKDNVDVPSPQPDTTFEKVASDFVEANYDLVIAHGGQLKNAIEKVALKYPNNKFALANVYPGNNKNLAGIFYRTTESGYLLGILAGLVTKTHKVILISGSETPSAIENAKFATKGLKFIDPKATFEFKISGSFTDEVKAKKSGEEAIASGADVLIVNAGNTNKVIAKLAEEAGIKVIGINEDIYNFAPQAVISSMLPQFQSIYREAVTLLLQGRWEGKPYRFGIKEKAIEFAPFRGSLTPEQEAKFNKIKEDIILDKIDILT